MSKFFQKVIFGFLVIASIMSVEESKAQVPGYKNVASVISFLLDDMDFNLPITMGAVWSTYTDSNVYSTASPYRVMNNTWATSPSTTPRYAGAGWSQQVGMSAVAAGAVSGRFIWNFPTYDAAFKQNNGDVISYPELAYGLLEDLPKLPDSLLPKSLASLTSLVTSYQSAVGSFSGYGQLTYDLWLIQQDTSGANFNLAKKAGVEIMMPVLPFNDYGLPKAIDYPSAQPGRVPIVDFTASRVAGLDTKRVTIDGVDYDLFRKVGAVPGYIVVMPVRFPGFAGGAVSWKPIFNQLVSLGWIASTYFVANVELGVETINSTKGAKGDLIINGFSVQVQ